MTIRNPFEYEAATNSQATRSPLISSTTSTTRVLSTLLAMW